MKLTDWHKTALDRAVNAAMSDDLGLIIAKHKRTGRYSALLATRSVNQDKSVNVHPFAVVLEDGELDEFIPPDGALPVKEEG